LTYEVVSKWPNPRESVISHCYGKDKPSPGAICQLGLPWSPLAALSGTLLVKFITVYFFYNWMTRRMKHERLFNSIGDFIVLAVKEPAFRHGRRGSKLNRFDRKKAVKWGATAGYQDILVWIYWVSIVSCLVYLIILRGSILEYAGDSMTSKSLVRQYPMGYIHHMLTVEIDSLNPITPAGFQRLLFFTNFPQLLVSSSYLLWNNQITRIWMEQEWRSFHRKRKVPRVTHDSDAIENVRATRFLQLPYVMTGFLMTLSTLLHWLVSQSLFIFGGLSGYTSGLRVELSSSLRLVRL
jgi:hypothetical protein